MWRSGGGREEKKTRKKRVEDGTQRKDGWEREGGREESKRVGWGKKEVRGSCRRAQSGMQGAK